MSDNNEQFTLDDGRKAEKIVTESKVNDQESQRVIEIKVEEKRPLKTHQKITEKMKSYMYERVIETVDQETGKVVDVKVEKFDCVTGAVQESNTTPATGLKSLGAIEEAETQTKTGYDVKNIVLLAVVLAQVIGLVYLLFLAK